MKKYVTAIILIVILLICFSSCDQSSTNGDPSSGEMHTHSFSEWTVHTPPSCTSNGLRERTCATCDATEYATIKKLPHTVAVDAALSPTCTLAGKTAGSHCAVCGDILVEQKTVEALGHTVVIDPMVFPTCTVNGKSEGSHCGVCQTVLLKQAELASLGHRYNGGEITDVATFWKPGKITFTCTADRCTSSYDEEYSVTTITSDENYTPSVSDMLYSFCAISDIHLTYQTADTDFQRALLYAAENCDFTCIAGDLTSSGSKSELQLYKSIVDSYSPTTPVYAIAGNHENYSTSSQEYWEECVQTPLYYSFEVGDDVFIMLGHYGGYGGDGIGWKSDEFVSLEEIQWLYETLEANRNKRCFIFGHVLPHEHGVGNPGGLYTNALIWHTKDNGIGEALISLLKHYKNAIFFHGHSHTRLELAALDDRANCSDDNGYRSVHIPSLSVPRDVVNGTLTNIYEESEGYIIDVYRDHVVLRGRDFIDRDRDGHWIFHATYKIDTTLYTVEANTFRDNTGTIVVAE